MKITRFNAIVLQWCHSFPLSANTGQHHAYMHAHTWQWTLWGGTVGCQGYNQTPKAGKTWAIMSTCLVCFHQTFFSHCHVCFWEVQTTSDFRLNGCQTLSANVASPARTRVCFQLGSQGCVRVFLSRLLSLHMSLGLPLPLSVPLTRWFSLQGLRLDFSPHCFTFSQFASSFFPQWVSYKVTSRRPSSTHRQSPASQSPDTKTINLPWT